MDVRPGHSIGVNYARVQRGWLLSPQYRPNEVLKEIRYLWQYRDDQKLEIRVRQRYDLDQLQSATRKGDAFDIYIRITLRYALLD